MIVVSAGVTAGGRDDGTLGCPARLDPSGRSKAGAPLGVRHASPIPSGCLARLLWLLHQAYPMLGSSGIALRVNTPLP